MKIIEAAAPQHIHSFAPLENPAAKALILGSMPGKESLRAAQYYAHPRNLFWTIMGELVGASPDLPYRRRMHILESSGLALWDVLESCIRTSSLDAHIEEASIVPNDFSTFYLRHPNLTHVFFNGAKAEQAYQRYVLPELKTPLLRYCRLPSTSPANAGTTYQQKLLAWRAVAAAISG
ncbi:MAG: DNA-deoxyinosine glycosylase [Pseudomonadota bacterium]